MQKFRAFSKITLPSFLLLHTVSSSLLYLAVKYLSQIMLDYVLGIYLNFCSFSKHVQSFYYGDMFAEWDI